MNWIQSDYRMFSLRIDLVFILSVVPPTAIGGTTATCAQNYQMGCPRTDEILYQRCPRISRSFTAHPLLNIWALQDSGCKRGLKPPVSNNDRAI